MKNREGVCQSGSLSYERREKGLAESANPWKRKGKKRYEIFTDFSLMVRADFGVYG